MWDCKVDIEVWNCRKELVFFIPEIGANAFQFRKKYLQISQSVRVQKKEACFCVSVFYTAKAMEVSTTCIDSPFSSSHPVYGIYLTPSLHVCHKQKPTNPRATFSVSVRVYASGWVWMGKKAVITQGRERGGRENGVNKQKTNMYNCNYTCNKQFPKKNPLFVVKRKLNKSKKIIYKRKKFF